MVVICYSSNDSVSREKKTEKVYSYFIIPLILLDDWFSF